MGSSNAARKLVQWEKVLEAQKWSKNPIPNHFIKNKPEPAKRSEKGI